MAIDAWLPAGFVLPAGGACRRAVLEGVDWQVYDLANGGRALVVRESLLSRWKVEGLLEHVAPSTCSFAGTPLGIIDSAPGQTLGPVTEGRGPASKSEALSFAVALRSTRAILPGTSLHDALYVERISRLLPTYSLGPTAEDDIVLGTWLTGGVRVSTRTGRRLKSLVWALSAADLVDVTVAAGLHPSEASLKAPRVDAPARPETGAAAESHGAEARTFRLPGRRDLERFFKEHVIDIVENEGKYAALGVRFPSPVALHGPPGAGKTYAVERLVDYLGWPSFSVDSSSIGSPYIHETGRKIAKVFDDAIKASPAVVVIDEMESFLSDRQGASTTGLHHVEEVAEFLRRIPEAMENRVFLVGMTNRIEMIDKAILRRGRFDHVLEVGMPSEEEIVSMLQGVLSKMPGGDLVDAGELAPALVGRPLSDAAFVVREGARLAAKSGRSTVDLPSLRAALESLAKPRDSEPNRPPIGFRKS